MTNRKMGLLPSTPKEMDKLLESFVRRQGGALFGEVAPHLKDSGKGKLITPYKSAQKFQSDIFGDENQDGPDCTSHACRNAIDIARAVEIDIKSEPEEWVARTSCEAIYAGRGHGGRGMGIARAANIVHEYGFMSRKDYGFVDFSKYNYSIGARLGSRGIPEEWLDAMSEHPMVYMAKAERPEDVRDALANGMGVFRGAYNYGVPSRRGENGIVHIGRGRFNHAQAIAFWDDTCELHPEPLVGEINSWNGWNAGPHPAWGKIPVGSYLVPLSNWVDMIFSQNEVFIVGDSKGYPAKELPNYGFEDWI